MTIESGLKAQSINYIDVGRLKNGDFFMLNEVFYRKSDAPTALQSCLQEDECFATAVGDNYITIFNKGKSVVIVNLVDIEVGKHRPKLLFQRT